MSILKSILDIFFIVILYVMNIKMQIGIIEHLLLVGNNLVYKDYMLLRSPERLKLFYKIFLMMC